MRKSTETRVYLAAFAAIGLITLCMNAYLDGRAAEMPSRVRAIDAAVAQERQNTEDASGKAVYWADKYQSLADESDGITVIAAEAKFQEASR